MNDSVTAANSRIEALSRAREGLQVFALGDWRTNSLTIAGLFLDDLADRLPELRPAGWRCQNCWMERLPFRKPDTPCVLRCQGCRPYMLAARWDHVGTALDVRFFEGLRLLLRLKYLAEGQSEAEAANSSRVQAHNWLRPVPGEEVPLFASFIIERCTVDELREWWITNGWRPSPLPGEAPPPPSSVSRAALFRAYRRWYSQTARPGYSEHTRADFFRAVEKNVPGIKPRTFGRRHERGWDGIGLLKKG